MFQLIKVIDKTGRILVQYKSDIIPHKDDLINILNVKYKVINIEHAIAFNQRGAGSHGVIVNILVEELNL